MKNLGRSQRRPKPDCVATMLNVEDIARVAHEVNRAYCAALGDHSQVAWGEAPDWQKDSALAGITAHLGSDLTPRESHDLWCQHKLKEGWSWGVDKDEIAKRHPCLIPYNSLPTEQRVKDYLFSAVVNSLKHLTL